MSVKAMRPTRTQSALRVRSARPDEIRPNTESTKAMTTEKCPISMIMRFFYRGRGGFGFIPPTIS